MSRSDDIVCVPDVVDNAYLRFISNLGIGPKNENVMVISDDSHPNSAASLSDILTCDYEGLLNIRNMAKKNMKVVLNLYMLKPGDFKLAAVLETD